MQDGPTVVGAKSETEVNLVVKKKHIISPNFSRMAKSHLKFFVVVLMNL